MLVLPLICQIIENTILTGLIKRFNQQGKIVTWNLAQDKFHPDSDNEPLLVCRLDFIEPCVTRKRHK